MGDLRERGGGEGVEFVAASALRADEPSGFEDVEVLGYRLARRSESVRHRELVADLEERLFLALGELVEDHASGLISQRPEDIRHASP